MHFLKNFRDLDRYTRLSIIIIILSIILRFALVFLYHPSGDACWHLSVSRFIADNLKIPLLEPLGREVFWEPPVFHLISATFYKIFSIFGIVAAEFALKLISPVFGSLSLILTFMIVNNFFGKKIAFYSTIFATFLPLNMFYGVIAYTESIMTFFALLSVYLIIKNKYILGSIAFGISLLSKYNAVFTLPLIMYIMHKNNKPRQFLKKFFIFGTIAALIFLPWVVRNYISLHNPLWPFFTSVFGGYESVETFKGNNISSLLNISNLFTIYLGIFGVPEGNYQNIFFFKIPFIEIIFAVWLLATFLFLIPIFFYSSKKKTLFNVNIFIIIWIVPHLVLIALYLINTSVAHPRLLMPAIPMLGVMWSLGFSYIKERLYKFRFVMFFILTALIIGFVSGEFVKMALASKAWNFYEEDFDWVRENTSKDSVFLVGGQCLSYNLNRFTINPTEENLNKSDYIWLNQNLKLDRHSILDEKTLKFILSKNYKIVYFNKDTGTTIYAIKQ